MSPTLLQINFNFSSTPAAYEAASAPAAAFIAGVPGLAWKIWPISEERSEAGGIYLFESAEAASAFALQVAAMLSADPTFSNVSIKQFGVIEALTAVTRGPVAPAQTTTFAGLAAAALAAVPSVTPAEAQRRLAADPYTLVIDVRDAADVAVTGTVPGALNISYGALTYQADHQAPEPWRAPQLSDHDRPIITTCILGPLGALGGKLLHDMGFTDVAILEGGVQAWMEAGLPVATNGKS